MRSNLLRQFREGKTPSEIEGNYSMKTKYKYYRLHLILEIRNVTQNIVDDESWIDISVSKLKGILEEVKKW